MTEREWERQKAERLLRTDRRISGILDNLRNAIYAKTQDAFARHGDMAFAGRFLADFEETIRVTYREMGVDICGVFRQALPEEMQAYYDKAVEDIRKDGRRRAILGKPDTARVRQALDSAYEDVAGRTTRMNAAHIRSLRDLSAQIFREASLTGQPRREVTAKFLERIQTVPGFRFVANNNVVWPDKAYFRMLGRTVLMNGGRAAYDDKCAKEGYDLMELTVSGHPCPECAAYEGKVFSLTGATKGFPTKQDLLDAGVFHPNCTHSYTALSEFELHEMGIDAHQPNARQDAEDREREEEEARRAEQEEKHHLHAQTIVREYKQVSIENEEKKRLQSCRAERDEAERGNTELRRELYTLVNGTEEDRRRITEQWARESSEGKATRQAEIAKYQEQKTALEEEYRRLVDAVGLGEKVSNRELVDIEGAMRRADRKLKLAQWDDDIHRDAIGRGNLVYIAGELARNAGGLAADGHGHLVEVVASRMLELQAKRMSSTLRDAFRPGMERMGRLPKVVMEKTISNQTRGAHYSPTDNTIHLDCKYGDWNGLPGTAQHEFGHWFDYAIVRRQSASRFDGLEKAKKKDLKAFFTDSKKTPPASYSDAEKIAMFGNDDDTRSGSFWENLNRELFGHPRSANNKEERYVITAYADTLQSLTYGEYGWGHDRSYVGKYKEYEEAVAETYMAYARGDLKFRDTFPELWRYIREQVKKVEKFQ